jgi:hypothetical protein
MRIGDVWLENGDGTPNITAMTARSALMIIPSQPVDDLLPAAEEIEIKTQDMRFEVRVTRGKMRGLLKALDKCRAAIGLSGGAHR